MEGIPPPPPPSVFDQPNIGGYQSFDRDQLAYSNRAVDRQRYACDLVRVYRSLAVCRG